MDLSSSPTLQHADTPSLHFCSFLFVPFQYHAVHFVILNEVKDLASENSGSWTLHLL
jgi:hypothetical protein